MRGHKAGGAVAVVLLGLVAGCGGGGGTGPAEPADVASATSTLPPAEGGPLTDLPECAAAPAPVDEDQAADLVLPDDTVVTGVEDLGELVSVRAYVALTPIQVRRFYGAAPGLKLYALEDEVYEAEILYGADEQRVFVRAQAQCRQGSALSVFVGPEDGEGLPELSGK